MFNGDPNKNPAPQLKWLDALLTEAGRRGYKLWKKADGEIGISFPRRDGKIYHDTEFEKRLKQAKPALKTHMDGPTTAQALKKVSQETFVERANNWLNRMRDKYATPQLANVIRTMGGEIPGGDAPLSPEGTSELSVANAVDKFVMPDSPEGKALSLASLINPGERALGLVGEGEEYAASLPAAYKAAKQARIMRAAVPMAASALTKGAATRGGLGNKTVGGFEGALEAIPQVIMGEAANIPAGGKKLFNWARKNTLVKAYDDVVPGQKLAQILDPKGDGAFTRIITGGKQNWVQALRSKPVMEEMGQRYESGLDDIQNSIDWNIQDKAEKLDTAFKDRWGFDHNKPLPPIARGTGTPMADQMYDESVALNKAKSELYKGAQDLKGEVKQLRQVRAKAFDKFGHPKQGVMMKDETGSPVSALDRYYEIKDGLKLSLADESRGGSASLANAYENVNADYSRYAALRDIADRDLAKGQNFGDHVNLDHWQRSIEDDTRLKEGRLGESFDDLQNIFRRNSPPIEGFDKPGYLERARVHESGGKFRVFTNVGDFLRYGPFAKPVGEVPGLLPKQPPLGPPPRLAKYLLGETPTAAISASRSALNRKQSNPVIMGNPAEIERK